LKAHSEVKIIHRLKFSTAQAECSPEARAHFYREQRLGRASNANGATHNTKQNYCLVKNLPALMSLTSVYPSHATRTCTADVTLASPSPAPHHGTPRSLPHHPQPRHATLAAPSPAPHHGTPRPLPHHPHHTTARHACSLHGPSRWQ
jgi:hypothetical protein